MFSPPKERTIRPYWDRCDTRHGRTVRKAGSYSTRSSYLQVAPLHSSLRITCQPPIQSITLSTIPVHPFPQQTRSPMPCKNPLEPAGSWLLYGIVTNLLIVGRAVSFSSSPLSGGLCCISSYKYCSSTFVHVFRGFRRVCMHVARDLWWLKTEASLRGLSLIAFRSWSMNKARDRHVGTLDA